MSNPTDTNQASEDEIRDLLRIIDIESGDEPYSYWIDDNSIEKATAAIQAYIRTEKLKLLAEVRERVVGEDALVDYGTQRPTVNQLNLNKNELRAEQRIELTKIKQAIEACVTTRVKEAEL